MRDESLQKHCDFPSVAFPRALDLSGEILPIERQVGCLTRYPAQRLGLVQSPGEEVALVK
jgi:hypothetical protein